MTSKMDEFEYEKDDTVVARWSSKKGKKGDKSGWFKGERSLSNRV